VRPKASPAGSVYQTRQYFKRNSLPNTGCRLRNASER